MQEAFIWDSHLQDVTNMVRHHHDQDERETDGARHRDGVLSVLKGEFQNQLEKEFTDEDWLHCLYLGSIKTRFEIWKDENWRIKIYFRPIQGHSGGNDHITEIDELRDACLQMEAIYLSRGSSTRSILHCRNWHAGRRKGKWRRKSNNRLRSSWSVQQRCRWSRINYTYLETKKSTLSKLLKFWTKCIVLDSLVHSTRCWSRILAHGFECHYYVPVCGPKNASSKLSAKVGKENCSRDSSHLE